MFSIIEILLSPSRYLYKYLSDRDDKVPTVFWKNWVRFFYKFEIGTTITLVSLGIFYPEIKNCIYIAAPLIFISYSRINELAWAFCKDALDKFEGVGGRGANNVERLILALSCYLGLIFYFAILYYFSWMECAFSMPLKTFFDSLYFSVVTITTLGYGEIHPTIWTTKLLVMYQALLGITMIVLVIGVYLNQSEPNKKRQSDA